ncbi:MAG TPA: prepilin-type N-terminal cleavage/methylation domain-containing protein [Thermoanaerobaculia bacterium]
MKQQRGFSLMEIIVVLALVSGLMIVVYTLIDETLQTAMFNESHNDLTIMSQRAVNQMHVELLQSSMAFEDNTLGNQYRTALQIPATTPVMPNTLLPVFDTATAVNPDTGTGAARRTGNSLLIVRVLAPLESSADPREHKPVLYDHDNDAANPSPTPEIELPIDRYRFEYFFLSRNAGRSFGGAGYYLDLVRAASDEYVDFTQLSSLNATQLRRVTSQLWTYGYRRAWDPGQPVPSAFYDLGRPRITGAFDPPIANANIPIAKSASILPEMRGGRIAGRMEYSVAFRPTARPPFPIRQPVSMYAQQNAALPAFPAGFEVKIAGPSGFRRAFVRLVLVSNYRATNYESQQATVTTATRF